MPPHRVQRAARTRKEPVHKTSRRELHPIQRAFLCGALLGGASQQSLSRDHGISQATISRTLTRLKARAVSMGIDDLKISDPCLIKDAVKLFEDQSRRGRKELLTPEQRALVVSVATRNKEAMKAKSSDFVGMRKLADGTVERTMDPELVALGLPQMSTSTFEGCMYEAGYVRTKDGWKKVGGAKREKAAVDAAALFARAEDDDDQTISHFRSEDLAEDAIGDNGDSFLDPDICDSAQQSSARSNPDLQPSTHPPYDPVQRTLPAHRSTPLVDPRLESGSTEHGSTALVNSASAQVDDIRREHYHTEYSQSSQHT